MTEFMYLCCDIFREREQQHANLDNYFGFLTALNRVVFYGSMSNTRIKFVIALQAESKQIPESKAKSALQGIHSHYTKFGMLICILTS